VRAVAKLRSLRKKKETNMQIEKLELQAFKFMQVKKGSDSG